MPTPRSLGDFCRHILDTGEAHNAFDPVRLGAIFREYAGIRTTPTLLRTIRMVRSLGIKIEAVDYLKSGGTNMTANGLWHIHYSANDKAPTQKFTIFHELFEIIQKSIGLQDANFILLKEPELSRSVSRRKNTWSTSSRRSSAIKRLLNFPGIVFDTFDYRRSR